MLDIKIGAAERSKLGGDERTEPFVSVGSFEAARYWNLQYRSEDLEDSELRYSLGSEGVYDIGFSYNVFEG